MRRPISEWMVEWLWVSPEARVNRALWADVEDWLMSKPLVDESDVTP